MARIAQTIIGSFNRLVSSATVMSDAEGSQCIMYPLILGAQAVHVARAGAAPSMDAEAEQEDVALLVPELAAEAAQSGESADRARLAYFSKEANRKVRCPAVLWEAGAGGGERSVGPPQLAL